MEREDHGLLIASDAAAKLAATPLSPEWQADSNDAPQTYAFSAPNGIRTRASTREGGDLGR